MMMLLLLMMMPCWQPSHASLQRALARWTTFLDGQPQPLLHASTARGQTGSAPWLQRQHTR